MLLESSQPIYHRRIVREPLELIDDQRQCTLQHRKGISGLGNFAELKASRKVGAGEYQPRHQSGRIIVRRGEQAQMALPQDQQLEIGYNVGEAPAQLMSLVARTVVQRDR